MPRLDVTYPAIPATVPEARAAFVAAFSNLPGVVMNDCKVLLTELVTNGIRHGASADGWVRLVVRQLDRGLRIEVTDSGELASRPRARRPQADQVSGWGLQIVGNLATSWGVTNEGGWTIWCELALDM